HGRVVGITRKYTAPEPWFVEIGHDFPVPLPPDAVEAFGAAVRRALIGLGLTWGPAHTELRWFNRRVAIIEVNPRLAGGVIPKLVYLARGVDLISATIAAAAGSGLNLEPAGEDYASIRFLVPQEEGTLIGIDGIDTVRQMSGVCDVQPLYDPGHLCRLQRDF